jgi:hypothetical protein
MNLRQIYERIKNGYEIRGIQVDDDQIRREAWVTRDRMIYESSLNQSSSSSAAGAGGGGSGNRRRVQPVIEVGIDQSTLYYEFDNDNETFSYFVYNFLTNKLSDILVINGVTNVSNRFVLTGIGFGFLFELGDDLSVYYIDNNGGIIWNKSIDNYISNSINGKYMIVKYQIGDEYYFSILDYLKNHRVIEIDSNINFNGLFKGGITVVNFIDNEFYVLKDGSTELISIGVGNFESNENCEYIFNLDGDIKAYGVDGSVISTFITEDNIIDYRFIENSFFIIFGKPSNKQVVFFSGVSKTFSSKLFPDQSYYIDAGGQKRSDESRNRISEGAASINFYDGEINYILPIWSTDEELRNPYEYDNLFIFSDLDDSNFTLTRSRDYITSLIYNEVELYYFSDTGSNNEINDGGNDMYDGGNKIYVDDNQIEYTHTQLDFKRDSGILLDEFIIDGVIFSGPSASSFGPSSSSEYFTNLYPGLFVLGANGVDINDFEIRGNLGADGWGIQDEFKFDFTYNEKTWGVFVKVVGGTKDPSINQIIIVDKSSTEINHIVPDPVNTDNNLQRIEDLSGVTELYYLLFAFNKGIRIDNSKFSELNGIVAEFIKIIDSTSDLSEFLNELNSNYSNITGLFNQPGTTNHSILRFNRVGEQFNILPTEIESSWDLRDDEQINGKTIIEFRKDDTGPFGFDDLSNLEERKFVSFLRANNGEIGNNVLSQDFIMKETTTNRYWKVKFISWAQNNNGGGFSYERTEIDLSGVEIGPLVEFTKTNFGSEVDVIIEGVLEITRGNNGPIYNSAVESSSNRNISPSGTLWNSRLSYGRIRRFVVIGLDGSVIDSLVISNSDYDDESRGSTFILFDYDSQSVFVSNDSNDKKFVELPKFYDDYNNSNSYTTETGIRLGNYILYNWGDLENVIVTPNSISKEFSPSTSGFNTFKIEDRYIFENGFLLVCSGQKIVGPTIEFRIIEYYNLNGDLLFRKELDLFRTFDGSFNIIDHVGKRASIVWSYEDNIKNVIFFRGDSVFEFNTGLTGDIDYLINDFIWWD